MEEQLYKVCLSVAYQVYPTDFPSRTLYLASCTKVYVDHRIVRPYIPYNYTPVIDPTLAMWLSTGVTLIMFLFVAFLTMAVCVKALNRKEK